MDKEESVRQETQSPGRKSVDEAQLNDIELVQLEGGSKDGRLQVPESLDQDKEMDLEDNHDNIIMPSTIGRPAHSRVQSNFEIKDSTLMNFTSNQHTLKKQT